MTRSWFCAGEAGVVDRQGKARSATAIGDLVEVYNDAGSTQAMAQPTPSAKRRQTFMRFGFPTGVQGNVINAGVNELIIPNYKQTWADIRFTGSASISGIRVIGIFGEGGVRATLNTGMDRYEYDSAAAIIIVMASEYVSSIVRHRVQ